jgi:predicted transcriptional regulator of viral defense system
MSEVGANLSPMGEQRVPGKGDLVRVVHRAELISAGLSEARIETLVRRGELVRVFRGFYVASESAGPILATANGKYLLTSAGVVRSAGANAVASHATAALIHGLDLLKDPGPVVMITRPPATSRAARPGVQLHSARLLRDHVTVRFGIPVTTVARTVIDIARAADFRSSVVAADSALHSRQTTKKELQAVLATCRRWPGTAQAAAVVAFADGRSESVLESIARVLFRDYGLPPPDLQVYVGGDEVIGRADFYWKKFRTIAEVDGALKYRDPLRARMQLRRDKELRDAGFEVVHFGWQEINYEPRKVVTSIRAAFRRGAAA